MQKIRCERKELSNLLKSYFKNNNLVVSLINQIEENEQYGPETLNTTIMQELIKNSNLNKYARRYSKTLKEVAFVLMSYSPSAYEMLKNFIPMPSLKTVRDSFSFEMNQTKENLLNIKQIQILLHKIHQSYTDDDNEKIVSVLSCDAATMNPLNTGKKALFGYNLQPIKPEYKSQIVHVEPNDNGRFNDYIIDVADTIIEEADECNFEIINFATDADSKTNAMHRSFYDYIMGIEGDFDEKVDKINDYDGDRMISDPLHLYKSMRRKYLTNVIQMSTNGFLINKEIERKYLEKSGVYKKDVEINSTLATMRDDLSLMLFNTQNLFTLGQNERYSFFTFQFFIVLMITAHQSNNLSANARYRAEFKKKR